MAAQNRNDPCACGSGLKYKRCHLPQDQASAAEAARAKVAVEGEDREPELGMLARHFPNLKLPADTAARAAEAQRVLRWRGARRANYRAAELDQVRFERACHARWLGLANADPALLDARERLRLANGPDFKFGSMDGYRERVAALREPLEALRVAGEASVPHLGILLTEDAWSSVLAVELLTQMPHGPLRDRALVEALFLAGDWRPDTSVRHLGDAPTESRQTAFEKVVTDAAADETPLHSTFWVPLFETGHDDPGAPLRPTPKLGPALELLYDLGHLSALAAGIERCLDPTFSGPDDVRSFLDDPGIQAAFAGMNQRGPRSKLVAMLKPAA